MPFYAVGSAETEAGFSLQIPEAVYENANSDEHQGQEQHGLYSGPEVCRCMICCLYGLLIFDFSVPMCCMPLLTEPFRYSFGVT